MLKKTKEVEAEKDKALKEAQKECERAEKFKADYEKEKYKAEQAEKEKHQADSLARYIEGKAEASKTAYKAVFTGIGIPYTLTIAIIMLVERRKVLLECGKWFSDRCNNLISLFLSLKNIYMSVVAFFSKTFTGITSVWCYVITTFISLVVAASLFFLFCWIFSIVVVKLAAIKEQYKDGLFKAILSISIAISLFYGCLYLYEPIKGIVNLNIFSVWMIISFISTIIVNLKEIVGGVKRGY
jgi:hypothetical protein